MAVGPPMMFSVPSLDGAWLTLSPNMASFEELGEGLG